MLGISITLRRAGWNECKTQDRTCVWHCIWRRIVGLCDIPASWRRYTLIRESVRVFYEIHMMGRSYMRRVDNGTWKDNEFHRSIRQSNRKLILQNWETRFKCKEKRDSWECWKEYHEYHIRIDERIRNSDYGIVEKILSSEKHDLISQSAKINRFLHVFSEAISSSDTTTLGGGSRNSPSNTCKETSYNNNKSQNDLTSEIINSNDVVMDSPEPRERESRTIKPTPETSEI